MEATGTEVWLPNLRETARPVSDGLPVFRSPVSWDATWESCWIILNNVALNRMRNSSQGSNIQEIPPSFHKHCWSPGRFKVLGYGTQEDSSHWSQRVKSYLFQLQLLRCKSSFVTHLFTPLCCGFLAVWIEDPGIKEMKHRDQVKSHQTIDLNSQVQGHQGNC